MKYLDEDRRRRLVQTLNGISGLCLSNVGSFFLRTDQPYEHAAVSMTTLVSIFEAVHPGLMRVNSGFSYDDIVAMLNNTPCARTLKRAHNLQFAHGSHWGVVDEHGNSPALLLVDCDAKPPRPSQRPRA